MSKSNDIKDFKDISKAAWDLISFIYESGQDSLIADNHKNSFRQKVTYKFTPRINPDKNDKKKEIITNKSANIERLPSLIPAKSLEEVNKISKYFKPNKCIKTQLLLFLLPLSCMVVPIGDIANKSSFSTNLFNTSTMNLNNNSTKPTMSSMNGIGIDIQAG